MPPKILKILACVGLSLACGVAAAVASTPPRASLRSFGCHRALDPPGRFIRVTALMRPLPGTQAMALKFDLLRRTKRGVAYTRVSGHDLGRWISPTSPPTLGQLAGDVWRLVKPIYNLPAPAAYRLRVSFRWTGASGQVLGQAVRTTAKCYQPELRPDLAAVPPVEVTATSTPGIDQYSVSIANNGATAAGQFNVRLTDGSVVMRRSITGLGARAMLARPLTFLGPACSPGAPPPTIVVDPNHRIDDYDRTNNSIVVSCS